MLLQLCSYSHGVLQENFSVLEELWERTAQEFESCLVVAFIHKVLEFAETIGNEVISAIGNNRHMTCEY